MSNTNGDEWTQVKRRGKTSTTILAQAEADPDINNPNPKPNLSTDELRKEHREIVSRWKQHESYTKLCAIVERHAPSHAFCHRAICLGAGTMDPANGAWRAKQSAHIQIAAFSTIVEIIEKASGSKIECIFQEPRFTEAEKHFLGSLGHKVVDSPAAYDFVDDGTFVYGIHLYPPIWEATLANALPALFVGTGWDNWQQMPLDPKIGSLVKVQEMAESEQYIHLTFPGDDNHTFSSTSIYWRQAEHADQPWEHPEKTVDLPNV